MAGEDLAPIYRVVRDAGLTDPVLIVALDGWVDAGLGASTALQLIIDTADTEVVASFDTDRFIDQRARRPVARIVNGITTELVWPDLRVLAGQDDVGQDFLLLTGPEPDFHWHRFVAAVVDLALQFEVRMVVGLGAFPAPAPHTRAIKLAATAPEDSTDLIERVGMVRGEIEVPAGITFAIELAMGDVGVPMLTLWARVPHYVAAMAFPEAAAALLQGLTHASGITFDTSSLRQAADVSRRQVDELIQANPEHVAMVRSLEATIDESEGNPFGLEDLPSGDELAAELEQFLRDEGGNT